MTWQNLTWQNLKFWRGTVLKRNNPRFLFSPVICLLYEALWSWRNVVFTVYCTTTVHNLFFQQITDIGYQVLLIWGSLFQRSYSIWSRAQWGCKISNEIFEIDHRCGSSPPVLWFPQHRSGGTSTNSWVSSLYFISSSVIGELLQCVLLMIL